MNNEHFKYGLDAYLKTGKLEEELNIGVNSYIKYFWKN